MKILKNRKWLILILTGVLALSIIMAGCSPASTTTTPAVSTPITTQPANTTANPTTSQPATSPASTLSGTITESGSTSVQPLAELLAAAFKTKNPNVTVTIQGGGSSVGIKAATDGTVNVGASSRELTAAEAANLKEFVLCKDGIAIIVNPANNVSNLTKEQVKNIFAGTITNWKDVGGADKSIHIVAREEGSGTRGAFEELIMGKDAKIATKAILQSSNGAILQVVKGDPDAVGFVSFGYLDNTAKALSIAGVAATADNAKNGSYIIVRPFLFVTKGEPTGLTKAFIDYCLSSEVQQIIIKEGYISVK
jgi:phosphate transport system substrate-binding protein